MIKILFIFYVVTTLGVAWYFRAKGKHSREQFLIDDKKLSTWGMAASSLASAADISGILFAVGVAYILGPQAFAIYGIMFLQYIAVAIFAPKLWRVAKRCDIITTSDIFYKRIGTKTNGLGALITVFLSFVMLSSAFSANSTLLTQVFGWNALTGTIFSGLIVIIYLSLGGFSAMVKTDVFQIIIMLLLLISPLLLTDFLSLGEIYELGPWLTLDGLEMQIGFWFFNMTNIQLWQKIIAAKNEQVARRGAFLSILSIPLFLLPLVYLSFNIRAALPGITDPQTALYAGVGTVLPTWFSPIILIALYAAMMSSVDTSLFGAAINFTENILAKIWRKAENHLVLFTRISMVVLLILSAIMSLKLQSAVWFLFNMSSIVGVLCFPLYTAIYRKLPDKITAFSIAVGLIVFTFVQSHSFFQANFAWKALPAVVTGLVLYISLAINKSKSKDIC